MIVFTIPFGRFKIVGKSFHNFHCVFLRLGTRAKHSGQVRYFKIEPDFGAKSRRFGVDIFQYKGRRRKKAEDESKDNQDNQEETEEFNRIFNVGCSIFNLSKQPCMA